MKILFLGARPDETPAIESWKASHPEHTVTVSSEVLSLATLPLVEGHDALVIQQVLVPEPEVYAELERLGITQLSVRSAGFDMYDLEAATRHGLGITNVPVYSPNAIAEYTLALALNLVRNIPATLDRVKQYDFRPAGLIGRELRTMKVAVLGTGRIGTRAAELFAALGAEVIGFDLYPNDAFRAIGTYAESVEDALRGADMVSLHMPATAENHHLLNKETLALLAEGAYVVNTGRGALVDTEALMEALDAGHLTSAALDVYEFEGAYAFKDMRGQTLEDPVYARLIAREDVLDTPHLAFYTHTAVENLVHGGLDNAVRMVETGECPTLVNPQVTEGR